MGEWSGVRDQVLALRKAPHPEKVFGARVRGFGHGFRLEPPLPEAEVAAAERELGVSFPSAYRTFLLEVGAGGAGPDYGVFPLRRDAQGWHWDDTGSRTVNARLSDSFPSTAERARWEEEFDAREPQRQDFPDEESFGVAFRSRDDEYEQLHEAMTAGAVCLSHQGCGYFTWLAVTGPERGTLWNDLRAADGLLEPVGAPSRVDFHAWYTAWLTGATSRAHAPG